MNNRLKDIIVVIIIPSFLIIMMFINIIKKDCEVSITERRKLEQFPGLALSNIVDGTFMKKFDKYSTDQFYNRDGFRLLKANIDLNIYKNYHNLYIYNDYIIEQIYPLNDSSVRSLARKINNIKDTYLDSSNKIYISIIPDKNYFVNDGNLKLDYDLLRDNFISKIDGGNYIDIFRELELDDYYKTDQHWKEERLFKVASKIANYMNIEIDDKYIEEEIIDFEGTYASRIPNNKKIKDTIKIIKNKDINMSYGYNYLTNSYSSIYDMSKIDSLDKYDIYLSGSVPIITITNNNSNNDKELIMFRDSFGSSLAPLLIPGYKKITLIDTRYVNPRILNNYIDFIDKDILFIYSTLLINDSSSIK